MEASAGDYERIIGPMEDQMLRSVWRITQHADDAEDALQEAMARIWQQWPRIRSHPHPTALVLRICCNAACDIVRRRKRRSAPLTADPASTKADAQRAVAERERREEIVAAIARLPERQAAAVSLRFLSSCSFEQIAQALDCAEPTARVHLARGLARLRTLLSALHAAPLQEDRT